MDENGELFDRLESLTVNMSMIGQDLKLLRKENNHLREMVEIMMGEPKMEEYIRRFKVKEKLKE